MRIITWNSQGYKAPTGEYAVMIQNCDVLCVQECGGLVVPANAEEICPGIYTWNQNLGTQTRPFLICIFYCPWGRNNIRCSLAVMVNLQTVRPLAGRTYCLGGFRPLIGVTLQPRGQENLVFEIFNIHAPASDSAARMVDSDYVTFVCKRDVQYAFLAGDFNLDPEQQPDWVQPNLACTPQGCYTHGVRRLDYMYCKDMPGNIQVARYIRTTGYGSDHEPVIFQF